MNTSIYCNGYFPDANPAEGIVGLIDANTGRQSVARLSHNPWGRRTLRKLGPSSSDVPAERAAEDARLDALDAYCLNTAAVRIGDSIRHMPAREGVKS